MTQRLTEYLNLCEEYESGGRCEATGEFSFARGSILADINQRTPTIRKILSLLDPALPDKLTVKDLGLALDFSSTITAVHEALGILADMDEWAVRLTPDSPSLPADRLHPAVWQPAAVLWGTGQFRVAVGQACVNLSTLIAAKAQSTRTERALVASAFSPKPATGTENRLHYPGERDDTWSSRQEGLHLLAQGAFAGIRNLAAHTLDEWTEQAALERLAVLSIVAHGMDATVLVTAGG